MHALQLSHVLSLAFVIFVGTFLRRLSHWNPSTSLMATSSGASPASRCSYRACVYDEFYFTSASTTHGHGSTTMYNTLASDLHLRCHPVPLLSANKSFVARVIEVLSLEDSDIMFIHDYHLWLLASFL
ncbi:Os07g0291300, partial [Oryza sativa Japonica Group]